MTEDRLRLDRPTRNNYLRFPVKLFEVRDSMTFIPVIATHLLVRPQEHRSIADPDTAEEYLLRRAGYAHEPITNALELPYVMLVRLVESGRLNSTYDPFGWDNRTMQVAHQHIIDNWRELVSGQVIDVEHLLGLRPEPKQSERITAPL